MTKLLTTITITTTTTTTTMTTTSATTPTTQSPEPRCHPGLQNKGKDEGGHARGKSRCDQFSAVISLVL